MKGKTSLNVKQEGWHPRSGLCCFSTQLFLFIIISVCFSLFLSLSAISFAATPGKVYDTRILVDASDDLAKK
ncbi:hypothetical protein [Piscirickettsia litoralis]|uniref:hypothetical protein n=1 Tax=Piscirickettsia litoralis TaxID=1891921 RepID=UPI001F25799A|nr:hypothetical protein [Piscirickettsia litoralis]